MDHINPTRGDFSTDSLESRVPPSRLDDRPVGAANVPTPPLSCDIQEQIADIEAARHSSSSGFRARRTSDASATNSSIVDMPGFDASNISTHIHELQRELEKARREIRSMKFRSVGEYQGPLASHRLGEEHIAEENAGAGNLDKRPRWNHEIKRWKRVTDRFGSTRIYRAKENIEDVRARSSGYVLTVYDEYDHEGYRSSVSLEINSAPLLELLRKVITYYPGDEFDILRGLEATGDTVTFADPSMILFTYRKQLEESLHHDHPEQAKEHLRILLDFMRKEHPKFHAKLMEIEEGRCTRIGFNYLWLLYPPNTPVYVGKGGVDRQMVVYSRASHINQKGQSMPLKLQCWDVDYEQRVFKRIFSTWVIEPYMGEKVQ